MGLSSLILAVLPIPSHDHVHKSNRIRQRVNDIVIFRSGSIQNTFNPILSIVHESKCCILRPLPVAICLISVLISRILSRSCVDPESVPLRIRSHGPIKAADDWRAALREYSASGIRLDSNCSRELLWPFRLRPNGSWPNMTCPTVPMVANFACRNYGSDCPPVRTFCHGDHLA